MNIRDHFNRAAHTYDDYCHLQSYVGERLIQQLKNHLSFADKILDLGCGTGIVTESLAKQISFCEFHATDIAEQLLTKAQQRLPSAQVYEMDFNALPTQPTHTFDLLFSNMALHWSTHFFTALSQFKKIAKPKHILAFTIPLSGTLLELKTQFAIREFHTAAQIEQFLLQCGYELAYNQQEAIQVAFETPLEALRSIKRIGANYVTHRTHSGLRGKSFLTSQAQQQLSYHIGYFIARSTS
jgi:malonyl-CoA O-methyltransferase